MAAFIKRTEGVYVSHHYVAKLWRETGLKPHQQGTFKVSKGNQSGPWLTCGVSVLGSTV
jgi:hypothetical protein